MEPSSRHPRRFLHWTLFAVAFGYVEAAVVVYLRQLYYPGGFRFPLVLAPDSAALTEIGREIATLLMLYAVAALGGGSRWHRFGAFAYLFGVWDLAFYLGLEAICGWPPSVLTWDVLFLLPLVWTGPVASAVLVAVLLAAGGARLAVLAGRGAALRARPRARLAGGLSLALLLAAFVANHRLVMSGGTPERFPWGLYGAGIALGLAALADVLASARNPLTRSASSG